MEKTTKKDKGHLVERDWRIARGSVKKDRTSWPQALRETRLLTKDELLRAKQTPVVLVVRKERGL